MNVQLIPIPTHILALHYILTQYLSHALRVLKGLAGFETARLEMAVILEA